MAPQMTEIVMTALQNAVKEAETKRHTEVSDIHLLKELFKDFKGYFSTFAETLKLNRSEIVKKLEETLKKLPTYDTFS